jgi:hypothetical protein
VHWAFATRGKEAFLQRHLHAFTELGGTAIDKIRDGNFKSSGVQGEPTRQHSSNNEVDGDNCCGSATLS